MPKKDVNFFIFNQNNNITISKFITFNTKSSMLDLFY